jgi:hypothetical protein
MFGGIRLFSYTEGSYGLIPLYRIMDGGDTVNLEAEGIGKRVGGGYGA